MKKKKNIITMNLIVRIRGVIGINWMDSAQDRGN